MRTGSERTSVSGLCVHVCVSENSLYEEDSIMCWKDSRDFYLTSTISYLNIVNQTQNCFKNGSIGSVDFTVVFINFG